MGQGALSVFSSSSSLYGKTYGKKKRFHLQQTQRNLLNLDVKSMATDQNPKKTVCLTCSQMVYLCNTRNSGSLPTLMNQSCLLSHCKPADEWGSAHQRELYHIYHRSDWIEAGGKTIKENHSLSFSFLPLSCLGKKITEMYFKVCIYMYIYIHTQLLESFVIFTVFKDPATNWYSLKVTVHKTITVIIKG